jgi:Protein of unknown function (DUF1588)/Protein of unknown function (DUF1592)/Protein of unknown function (DUF1595)/Protein of unknown function (DUF1587)
VKGCDQRLRGVALLGALALSACGGVSGNDKQHSSSSGGSGSSGGGPGADPSSVCGTSKVGAPRLRRLSRDELANTLADVFPDGTGALAVSFSADPISTHGFDNDATLLIVGKQLASELDRAGDAVGAAVSGAKLGAILPCSTSTKDAACAQQFLDKYAKRLFRRALSSEESGRYIALFKQVSAAKDFATGIRYVTRALVQSPYAVYRREVGALAGGTYKLTPAEVATELAYDFTGTAPTDDLLASAEAGQLASPEALESKARELLVSPNGLRVVEKFFNSWLGYGRASGISKPGVAEFNGLRDQMVGETSYFLGQVVVSSNGGLKDLLTATFTNPTASLAAFYGFPAPTADYAKTERPAGHGIGILAQASLLAALSGPGASSPTKRGVLVMDRLLCREKPMVPPDVPDLTPPQPGVFTTRQHYEEQHAKAPSCKACHSRFDPIGFGFEHYDEVGRYRELDGGLPVDSKSFVPTDDGTGHLFDFANLEELAQGLAAQKAPYACTTGYLSTYVYGAPEACLGETKRPLFVDQQLGFLDYLASLAAEPHFTQRRLE